MNSDTDLEPAFKLPEQVDGNDQTRMNIWLFVLIIIYNIRYKVAAEIVITSELAALFQSLGQCLDLRDKYMVKSLQRLGDNPRDYDGHFTGLDDGIADVSTIRPDSKIGTSQPSPSPFEPWKIYPSPPPPQWHRTDTEKVVPVDGNNPYRATSEFVYEDCPIPGSHNWDFAIDETGIFQVYEDVQGDSSL
jgi:AMP deaminase